MCAVYNVFLEINLSLCVHIFLQILRYASAGYWLKSIQVLASMAIRSLLADVVSHNVAWKISRTMLVTSFKTDDFRWIQVNFMVFITVNPGVSRNGPQFPAISRQRSPVVHGRACGVRRWRCPGTSTLTKWPSTRWLGMKYVDPMEGDEDEDGPSMNHVIYDNLRHFLTDSNGENLGKWWTMRN